MSVGPELPSTRFFGPTYMRRDDETLVEAPVGAQCQICHELVDEDDAGTINPYGQIHHNECLTRAVIGSVGHLMRRCSCYGGTEEDPPGVTYRQGARLALALWHAQQRSQGSGV